LSEHTAPYDAVVQIIDGNAEITIGGNAVHANEGNMVIMPQTFLTRFKHKPFQDAFDNDSRLAVDMSHAVLRMTQENEEDLYTSEEAVESQKLIGK